VAVEVDNAVAAASAQGQRGSEQIAALATQDHGEPVAVEQCAEPVRQPGAVGGDGRRVEDAVAGPPIASVMPGGVRYPGEPSIEAKIGFLHGFADRSSRRGGRRRSSLFSSCVGLPDAEGRAWLRWQYFDRSGSGRSCDGEM
jgi:hypothetical protein